MPNCSPHSGQRAWVCESVIGKICFLWQAGQTRVNSLNSITSRTGIAFRLNAASSANATVPHPAQIEAAIPNRSDSSS
jgi:hypothetical protein